MEKTAYGFAWPLPVKARASVTNELELMRGGRRRVLLRHLGQGLCKFTVGGQNVCLYLIHPAWPSQKV